MSTLPQPHNFLRERRIRIAIWTAVIEGVLVIIGPSYWRILVYVLAIAAIGFWLYAGRHFESETGRQASWIFATSQLIVVLVPIFLFIAKTVAIAVIALIAVGGLVFLFAERDRK